VNTKFGPIVTDAVASAYEKGRIRVRIAHTLPEIDTIIAEYGPTIPARPPSSEKRADLRPLPKKAS